MYPAPGFIPSSQPVFKTLWGLVAEEDPKVFLFGLFFKFRILCVALVVLELDL